MPLVKISLRSWPLLLALIGLLCGAGLAEAALREAETGRRVALVVGNTAYRTVAPLKNAARDAEEIARTLTSLGFEVIARTDVTREEFEAALGVFYASAQGADAAVIFYSGHGFQMNGVNYLVPVDAVLRDRSRIDAETVRLDEIAGRAQGANRQTLIFLDACRNNPLPEGLQTQGAGEGLAQLETGSGTFIAFATQPGNVTRDGAGAHSPFTSALLEHMPTAGISISDMMIRVRNSVEVATLHTQTPWDQSSLRSQFYFNPKPEAEADGVLTDEDREMLLALDPAMRRKFEAKFGINVDDEALDAEAATPAETAAIQPTVRVEPSVEASSMQSVVPMARNLATAPDMAPQVTATLRILPGAVSDAAAEPTFRTADTVAEAKPGVILGAAAAVTAPAVVPPAGGNATTVTTDFSSAMATGASPYAVADAAAVADSMVLSSRPASGGAAEKSPRPSSVVAASTRPEQERLAPRRQPDGVVASDDQASYEVASVFSAERSVALDTHPAVRLTPVAPSFQRIVGKDVTPAPSVPAPADVAPEVELAALDPAEIDRLAPGPPDLPDVAVAEPSPELPTDMPAAVQAELARLGCYRSAVDGDWGSGSARALLRYYATKKTDPDLLEPDSVLYARLSREEAVVCTRTEQETKRPAVAARPAAEQPRQASRPAPAQRQRVARPEAPKASTRTIATRPAAPSVPVKREAAATAGAPGKSLKRTLTIGAFR